MIVHVYFFNQIDEDENPVAEFIIIVVNADENAALDNVCDEH